jgi:hypothetical protein
MLNSANTPISQMSSSLVNYASRVLSVDQESTSFVPIIGLNKAADMPLIDSIMHAWRGCSVLRDAIEEGDMEVPTGLRSRCPRCCFPDAQLRSSLSERCCTSGTWPPPIPTA